MFGEPRSGSSTAESGLWSRRERRAREEVRASSRRGPTSGGFSRRPALHPLSRSRSHSHSQSHCSHRVMDTIERLNCILELGFRSRSTFLLPRFQRYRGPAANCPGSGLIPPPTAPAPAEGCTGGAGGSGNGGLAPPAPTSDGGGGGGAKAPYAPYAACCGGAGGRGGCGTALA